MKKIICAGCHRSGSTWLYNAVRLIAKSTGKEVYACFATTYDADNPAEIHVVKCHNFHKFLQDVDLVFTTKRDLRDIAASAHRRGLITFKDVLPYLHRIINLEYKPWRQYTSLEIPYEELVEDKKAYIKKLSEIMEIQVNVDEIHEAIENLAIPEKEFDPITQLHPNHITDGRVGSYQETLPEAVQKRINEEFYMWLKQNKYLEI
jgi:hypothetical protein